MKLSLRLALRYALRRPSRTLVTILGLAAGVAGLRAIELGTHGALSSVRTAYEQLAGPAALAVTPAGETNAPLPAGVMASLEKAAGVEAALPLVAVPTMRSEELNAWAAPLYPGEVTGVLVLGLDFARERHRGRFSLSAGEEPSEGAAVVGEGWAQERNLKPGDTLRLVAGDELLRLRISGLAARQGLGAKHHGQIVLAPIATVRKAFALAQGETHEAALILSPEAALDEVAARLSRELGDGVRVVRPAERGKDVAQRLANIRAATDLTSSLSLFLAAFLIYAMYATAAAERRRDLAILRCVGATRFQAALPLLVEALLFAVPGSILGALLGAPLAQGVSVALSKVAASEIHALPSDLPGAARAAAIGVLVALASALIPAVQGARVEPFEGVRSRAASSERASLPAILAWAAAALFALAWLTLDPPRAASQARTYALMMLLIAGCIGVLPATLGPLTRMLGALALRTLGGGAALGVAAARWRPSRTGLAAGAVLGCVAMVGALSGLGDGVRRQMGDWADQALGWDLFVRRPSGMDEAALQRVRQTPGVRYASPALVRPAEISTADGKRISLSLVGIDPEIYAADGTLMFPPGAAPDSAARVRSLGNHQSAFITGVLAQQFALASDATVTLESPAGPRPLKLVGEVVDYTQNGFALIVSEALLRESFGVTSADLVTVRLAKGARAEEVAAALSVPAGIRVETRAQLKGRVMTLVDDALGAMDALRWLSALVGLLAVGAAVALGAIERRGDLAALRSLGMSRRQVAAMVTAEALVTALVGAALGFGLGLYLGWVLSEATHRLGIPIPYLPPWRALGWASLAAVLSALPAAFFPARRAAAISPAEALREE